MMYHYVGSLNAGCLQVFLDVTEMIDFNLSLGDFPAQAAEPKSGPHPKSAGYCGAGESPNQAFFRLSPTDPTTGFSFSWDQLPAFTFPPAARLYPHDSSEFTVNQGNSPSSSLSSPEQILHKRLFLACHLADFLRTQVSANFNHTSSAGISTTKLTAKLAGSVNKPNKQTVLIPSATQQFLDEYEIGKIPGIGYKTAQKLRNAVLGQIDVAQKEDNERVYYFADDVHRVTVRDARLKLGDAEEVARLVGSKDAGKKIFGWLHGVDNAQVAQAPLMPTQISIEDTFRQLNTMPQVTQVLLQLTTKLVQRMRVDLLSPLDTGEKVGKQRWLVYPRTFRLSIRLHTSEPKSAPSEFFSRISRSAQLPRYVFALDWSVQAVAEKLVKEVIGGLFRRLYPWGEHGKGGGTQALDVQLVNVAVTNMAETRDAVGGGGEDIERMMKRARVVGAGGTPWDEEIREIERVYSRLKAEGEGVIDGASSTVNSGHWGKEVREIPDSDTLYPGKEDLLHRSDDGDEKPEELEEDDYSDGDQYMEGGTCGGDVQCPVCGACLPMFAVEAHARYHEMEAEDGYG